MLASGSALSTRSTASSPGGVGPSRSPSVAGPSSPVLAPLPGRSSSRLFTIDRSAFDYFEEPAAENAGDVTEEELETLD